MSKSRDLTPKEYIVLKACLFAQPKPGERRARKILTAIENNLELAALDIDGTPPPSRELIADLYGLSKRDLITITGTRKIANILVNPRGLEALKNYSGEQVETIDNTTIDEVVEQTQKPRVYRQKGDKRFNRIGDVSFKACHSIFKSGEFGLSLGEIIVKVGAKESSVKSSIKTLTRRGLIEEVQDRYVYIPLKDEV